MPWNTDLAMRWYRDAHRLPFDTRPQAREPAGWYRFVSPPGLRSLAMPTSQPVRAWADGKELPVRIARPGWRRRNFPSRRVRRWSWPSASSSSEAITAAQPSPTSSVSIAVSEKSSLGDWSKAGVLETYSGGAWYRRTVPLTPQQARRPMTLDLGQVAASAEVIVNGKPAGVKVAPPWRLHLTSLLKPGDNRLEILVCNTLANHYVTIPTHYRGSTVSGLLGPVRLEIDK